MAPRKKKIKKTETPTPEETTPLTIAKPSGKFDLSKFKVEAGRSDCQCRDVADGATRAQHGSGEGLRTAAPRRGSLLVG